MKTEIERARLARLQTGDRQTSADQPAIIFS